MSDELSGTEWPFGPTEFGSPWECYEEIRVGDFNLNVELQQVSLTPTEQGIALVAILGEVRGEDMDLIGARNSGINVCVDFNAELQYVELAEGYMTGELGAKVDDGALQLHFPESPILEGQLSSEILWFPDDLAWLFVENAVLNYASSLIESELPPLVNEFTAGGIALSTFGDLDVEIGPREIVANRDGLYAAVDVDLGGDGGVGTSLDLAPRDGSHLAVGLPGALAEEVLLAVWQRGLLTSNSELAEPLIDELLETLGLGDDVEVFVGVAAPPAVVIDESGIFMRLRDVRVTLTSADGEPLLDMLAGAEGWLEAQVRNGSIQLTVHELELLVDSLDAGPLLTRDADNLQSFLEGWVTDLAVQALDGISIWESHFEALGYVLRVDEASYTSGGLVAWFTLFDAEDPAVDRISPETEAEATPAEDQVLAAWRGEDDRAGPLMFRYRVDGGSWSRWTLQEAATLEGVSAGAHTLEVVARDGWFNEDLSPATVSFSVAAVEAPEPAPSCGGCASTGSLAPWWALGALGWGFSRRRRVRRSS